MRTTNKLFKTQVQEHILDRLSEEHGETTQDQLQAVANQFKDWYGPYEQKMHPNRQEAFTHWMDGLPSCLNTEYSYYNVNQTMKSWYETCGASYKKEEGDSEEYDLYKNLVYRELRNLWDKNNIRYY